MTKCPSESEMLVAVFRYVSLRFIEMLRVRLAQFPSILVEPVDNNINSDFPGVNPFSMFMNVRDSFRHETEGFFQG